MAKITIEELSGSLREYLNGLGLTEAQVQGLIDKFEDEKIGDISQLSTEEKESLVGAINEVNQKANKEVDLSNYQQKTDNNLQTSSKNLVGAINELFQNANNGKELIANAIGEPLSSEDTFSAMSNDINGLLSQFKTNMMNNGVTVNSSDRFKSLIDKIATLADSEGKGIQYATGQGTPTSIRPFIDVIGGSLNLYYLQVNNLTFKPSTILLGYSDPTYGDYTTFYSEELASDRVTLVNTKRDNITLGTLDNVVKSSSCTINSTGFILPVSMAKNYTWIAIGVGEEDTTLRDSLANILENKGVDVTEDDDMVSLITKVDSIKMGDCTNQDLINVLNNIGYKETKNLTLVSLASDNVNMDTSYYSIYTLWGNGRTYPLAILDGYDKYTLGTFKPRINFSKYNKIKLRAASNNGYQTGDILMMSNYIASTGTSSSTSATYRTTVNLAPTVTTYEIDISSWTGEGYLAIERSPYKDGTSWAFMIDSLELIANDNGLNGNETTEQLLSKLNTLSQPPKLTSGTTVTLDNPCLVVGTSGTYYHTYTHKAPSGTILFTVYIDQYSYTTNATVVHKRNDVTLSTTKFETVEEYNSSSGYYEAVTQYKDYDVQTGDIIEFTFVKGKGSGDRIDIAMLSADIEW